MIRRNSRKMYLIALSLVLFTNTLLVSCNHGRAKEHQHNEKPLALPIHVVESSNAETIKNYIGTIEGKINVEIRPQIEGLLQEIYVDEGTFVTKGQKLFKIDASAYQEALNNAIAIQNVAKAKLENAKLEIERLKPLVDNEVISNVKLKSAKSDYDVAKASLDQATAAVGSAKINQGFSIITATVSGYIGRIPKRIGNLVSKSDKEPLTVLSDAQDVYVYFSMNESDFLYFSKLKIKEDSINGIARNNNSLSFPDATLILADGEEYSAKGVVDAINGQVDRTTGAISLRASFPNSDNILRNGSTGTLKISEIKKNVFQIPQVATSELQDKTFVYMLDDENRVIRKVITIAGKSKSNYIVSNGVELGDRIVLTGLDKISEGTKILPIH
ncbi:efflux RND transporter periplasmic adaptor subunit [Sphingobacterium bovistauri]|uniref:Efflux RND transporter periplasmic adaptor subunit n=1 Tax=Sphingobacterium bovistauri TaxID=2781959 RepID=A0ABS7Z7Y8_9SPHI|nr:efflux RND transporter periplasmic adaptor subunit [Sphingobacterium bovistauri]MCA5006306.1 efflux RND transporter periplasmic adaptor subunit [Sphingobacterium bovistauri]